MTNSSAQIRTSSIHREVFAHRLDLNRQRHQQEIIGEFQAKPKTRAKPKGSSRKSKQAEIMGSLA